MFLGFLEVFCFFGVPQVVWFSRGVRFFGFLELLFVFLGFLRVLSFVLVLCFS